MMFGVKVFIILKSYLVSLAMEYIKTGYLSFNFNIFSIITVTFSSFGFSNIKKVPITPLK